MKRNFKHYASSIFLDENENELLQYKLDIHYRDEVNHEIGKM